MHFTVFFSLKEVKDEIKSAKMSEGVISHQQVRKQFLTSIQKAFSTT